MAYRNKKYAKCPKCCPDVPHACFKLEVGPPLRPINDCLPGEDKEPDIAFHWICQNCGYDLGVAKRLKPTGKLTKSQRRVIRFLRRNFGGVATWRFIGRNVYLKLDNPRRPWYDGKMAGGVVGPRGAYKITLYRLGGDKEITNGIDVSVYLRQESLKKADLEQNRKWLERMGVKDTRHAELETAGGCV